MDFHDFEILKQISWYYRIRIQNRQKALKNWNS